MALKVVFMGPQGSGKGTVIGRIKDHFNVPHISTGDMFREAIKNGTEFGLKAQEYMNKGELVPDEVTIGMVKERIAQPDCTNGFFLDGFPRNLSQAEALTSVTDITNAVLLDVPEEISLERLGGRRQCKSCGAIFHLKYIPPKQEGICDKDGGDLYQRDDDKDEAIKERLAIYRSETLPIADFYKAKNVLNVIDGSGAVDEIAEKVKEALA